MSFRNKVIVLSILVALFAISALLGLLFLPNGIVTGRSRPLLTTFNRTAVAHIEIINPAQSLTHRLVRQSEAVTDENAEDTEAWIYEEEGIEFPAQYSHVATLLEVLESLERQRTISSDSSRYGDFALDEEGARRLMLRDAAGNLLFQLYVGKSDEQGSGNYIRLQSDPTVYLASNSLDFYLEQLPGYWQQTRLFSPERNANDIDSFSLSSNIVLALDGESRQYSYTLVQQQSTEQEGLQWNLLNNPQLVLDSPQIASLLSAFVALNAASFVSQELAASGLDNPQVRAEATTTDGAELRLLVGNALPDNPAQYYALIEGSDQLLNEQGQPYLYRIEDWALRAILLSVDELLPPPPDVDPNASGEL